MLLFPVSAALFHCSRCIVCFDGPSHMTVLHEADKTIHLYSEEGTKKTQMRCAPISNLNLKLILCSKIVALKLIE